MKDIAKKIITGPICCFILYFPTGFSDIYFLECIKFNTFDADAAKIDIAPYFK